MRNAPEVVREVGVDDVRMATEHQLLHLNDCLLSVSPSAVGVDFRRKIGFKDRLQHQHRCCHGDPIPHGRDAQRPEFAVGLRYKHSSDWLLPVGLLPVPPPLVAPFWSQPPFPPRALPGFSGPPSLSATPARPTCPSRASGGSSLITR